MRVVLDTNTLVSALLFSGTASRLVPLWQSRRIRVVVSRAILREYLRTLAYPKFRLTPLEIRQLVEEEFLPFAETVRVSVRVATIKRDPEDTKFLECALAAHAEYVITGDRDLRDFGSFRGIPIVTVAEFLDRMAS